MKYWIRECYGNGIKKEEDKLYEFHVSCDCSKCRYRIQYLKQPRNGLTLITDSKDKFDKVIEFINDWKCKDGNNRLSTEYVRF